MGLIFASTPMTTSSALVNGANDILVITVVTEDESLRLYYSPQDSFDDISALLDKEGVSGFEKKFFLKSVVGITESQDEPSILANTLPGIKLQAKHPVTGQKSGLYYIIMSLNDDYKWKREDVADWIENTFDTVDIAFQTPVPKVTKEVSGENKGLSFSTKLVKIKRVLPV